MIKFWADMSEQIVKTPIKYHYISNLTMNKFMYHDNSLYIFKQQEATCTKYYKSLMLSC